MREGFGYLPKDKNYICNGLVDQGRTIGDDPVGYSCSRRAMWFDYFGRLWCAWCYEHPERVRFISPWGAWMQDEIVKKILESNDRVIL